MPAVVVRHGGPIGDADVPWSDVLAVVDADASMPEVDIAPDDDATIVYTSGTTGEPRGAVGSHRNHVSTFFNTAFAGVLGAARANHERPSGSPDRPSHPPAALMTYPFFHIGGLNTVCINTGFGMKTVLQYKWDLEEALALIERERVTSMAAVPTVLRQILQSPLLERYDISSLGHAGIRGRAGPARPGGADRPEVGLLGVAVQRVRADRDDVRRAASRRGCRRGPPSC